ncbi:MAG: V-type ATP synthase subunit F [Pseudomonadota bacterium]
MKLFVIADPETCLAFALAGIKGEAVRSDSQVPAVLKGLAREETDLVLITEALAQGNRELIDGLILQAPGMLILEIPDMQGPRTEKATAAERIASLLRR